MAIQNQNQDQIFFGTPAGPPSPPPPPPAAPTNLDIDIASDLGDVILTWTNNAAPPAVMNQVWVSVNGGAYLIFDSVPGNANTYTDMSRLVMNPGDVWNYKVVAVNAGGFSAFTNDVAAAVNPGALNAATYSYPTLIMTFDKFDTAAGGNAVTLNCPKLRVLRNPAGGGFGFGAETNLTTVDLPELLLIDTTGGRGLDFGGCTGMTSFSFPALQTAFGLDFNGCTNCTSISLPVLNGQAGDFIGDNLNSLVSFSLPQVTFVGTFSMITTGGPGSISLPLVSQAEVISIEGSNLTSLNLNSLGTVQTGNLNIVLTGLASISLPALTNVAGDFNAQQNASLTSLSVPSLSTVGGAVSFYLCPALTALDLSALTSLGGGIDGHGDSSLTSITVTGGVTINGDWLMNGCPSLTTVSVTNLVFADGGFNCDFSTCALTHTSIEDIVRRGVISGLTQETFDFTGGTNAHLSALSAQGQADVATLIGNGCVVNITP